jgi:hypothetical protein
MSTVATDTTPSNVEVFRLRSQARAALVANGEMDLRDAVDELQRVAESYGLIAEFGEDEIQRILSEAFRPFVETARSPIENARAAQVNEQATQADNGSGEKWPTMDEAAYYGLAGDFVRTLEPHTEADPAGLLIQFLIAFGNIVGNSPYYKVEEDRHHANLFAVLVGNSARGRKGTGAGRVRSLSQITDEVWAKDRNVSGLSSGEGLISSVRDKIVKWNTSDKCEETVDPGVSDKRLLVTEAEFAGTLSVMERSGNNLSPNIRNAWDGLTLQTLTKTPLKATGAHISIIGHITQDELCARLRRTDMANGFANRFLFALVKRSKRLPYGGHVDDGELATLGERFKQAVELAEPTGRVIMTDAAAAAWALAYEELSADRVGLLGAVTARAEAQVIRLSLVYALLDQGAGEIDTAHLDAAMAVWAYCDQSAHLIFGDSLGDPAADDILGALRRRPAGMTRTDISNLFARHRTSDQIGAALTLLLKLGRARFEEQQTNGRPVETWFAVGDRK